ncbi:hypothetical protein [Panacagrimonas sp.]|uniref:hypothetical protein n=1 Tax=Panacagrimonas sp. TaxID=2480088 RepID=UPI003B52AFF2
MDNPCLVASHRYFVTATLQELRVRRFFNHDGGSPVPRDIPPVPKDKLWSAAPVTGPSAGLVQAHFVKIRLGELERRGPEYEKKIIAALQQRLAGLNKSGMSWMDAFKLINSEMQRCDLTINFNETKWFSQKIDYESYAQMYELAGKKLPSYERDKMGADPYTLRTVGTNFAKQRADTDDGVTFPKHWKTDGASPLTRGLAPRAGLTPARVRLQMAVDATPWTGPMTKAQQDEGRRAQHPASPHFNPKTKQVFAALNYGKRLHGSAPLYGNSYFVLADHLKANAVYYPMDTFTYSSNVSMGIKQQFPYTHLAAAMAFNDKMGDDIIKACWNGTRAPNTLGTDMLLEAHIHGAVPFAGNIKKIVLCESDQMSAVALNAKKFARKWGAELAFNVPYS